MRRPSRKWRRPARAASAVKANDGIDSDGIKARKICRGDDEQFANSQPSKRKTADRAKGGEQKSLGEHLAGEMPPTRADGGAHSEFAFAERGADEEKVGHIGAGYEEQKNRRRP